MPTDPFITTLLAFIIDVYSRKGGVAFWGMSPILYGGLKGSGWVSPISFRAVKGWVTIKWGCKSFLHVDSNEHSECNGVEGKFHQKNCEKIDGPTWSSHENNCDPHDFHYLGVGHSLGQKHCLWIHNPPSFLNDPYIYASTYQKILWSHIIIK